MRQILVVLLLSLSQLVFSNNSCAGQEELTMTLTGDREQVLFVIKKSIEAEFTNATITDWSGRVGFWAQFKGFFTGATGLGAAISPLALGDASEVSAYRVDFSYKTQHLDGLPHIRALKLQIAKQASEMGKVTTLTSSEGYVPLFSQGDKCYSKLGTDQEISIISMKIPLSSPDSPTFTMLADESYPTDAERAAIISWGNKREQCFAMKKNALLYFPLDPRIAVLFDTVNKSNDLILNLYKSKLSFGEFNNKRKQLSFEANAKYVELQNSIVKDQANSQTKDAEVNRQNQLEQSRLYIEQQKADAMKAEANKIVIPTSQSTNCVSRPVGNTVQTSCN